MRFRSYLAAACVAAGLTTPVNAATLTVNGSGYLTGVNGVDVSGTLYDVTFKDGTFDSVFGNPPALDFTSNGSASTASQALMTALATATGGSAFLAAPGTIFGCVAPGNTQCYIMTPWSSQSTQVATVSVVALLVNLSVADEVLVPGFSPFSTILNTSGNNNLVYADWQASIPPVPLPAALPLLVTGLGALGVIGWRRKRKLAKAQA